MSALRRSKFSRTYTICSVHKLGVNEIKGFLACHKPDEIAPKFKKTLVLADLVGEEGLEPSKS
jgi:hypothetical protein